jgi:hypothetical protein
VLCAETFCVKKKNGGDQMFEIMEGLYWVAKTLCTPNEANAFSFWELNKVF